MPDRADLRSDAANHALLSEVADERVVPPRAHPEQPVTHADLAAEFVAIVRAMRDGGQTNASQSSAGNSTSEFSALRWSGIGTAAAALAATAVGYMESSPEAVLLVVVDLLPWIIGLAGVYIVCRTVVKVMEGRRQ